MDEKKIFLAYTYRALGLLYTHLYKVKAFAVFDNMYEYKDDEQCGCRDVMATPLSSLAFHYRVAKELKERYPSSRSINSYLVQCIDLLLDNQLPDRVLATHGGLYVHKYDKYNPIFSPLTDQ